jgi:hypothetical protein
LLVVFGALASLEAAPAAAAPPVATPQVALARPATPAAAQGALRPGAVLRVTTSRGLELAQVHEQHANGDVSVGWARDGRVERIPASALRVHEAAPQPGRAAAAPPPTPALVGRRQVPFLDASVREEHGVSGGRYIAPNELEQVLYEPVLSRLSGKGAILSVGTFRTADRATYARTGWGRQSPVVMLDLDRDATAFNAEMVSKAAEIPDRATFVTWARNYLAGRNPKALAEFERVLGDAPGAPEFRATSILGSDAMYAKFRLDARAGRYTAINGSLSGADALPSIAKAMTRSRQRVAVVDVSNAIEHMALADASGEASGRHSFLHKSVVGSDLESFASNLSALPWAEEGRVLFTVDTKSGRSRSWHYVSMPPKDFIEAVRGGAFTLPRGAPPGVTPVGLGLVSDIRSGKVRGELLSAPPTARNTSN